MTTTACAPIKAPRRLLALPSRVTFEDPDLARKRGQSSRLRREVEAMRFVQQHTSIPVPAILGVQLDDGPDDEDGWILMQRLPGLELGSAWPDMQCEARAEAVRQLKSHLEELHRLRPQGAGWIGSCSGGPAYDHRLSNMSTCGPFASVGDFHDYLVAPVRQCPRPDWVSKFRSQLPDTYEIRFAHADFSWENVLVDPSTGNISGILDWEMAGFWPEWWEYRKALFGSRSQPCWFQLLSEIMTEYQKETDVDMDLEMF